MYAHLKVKLQGHICIALKVTLLARIKLFIFQKESCAPVCVYLAWGQNSPREIELL